MRSELDRRATASSKELSSNSASVEPMTSIVRSSSSEELVRITARMPSSIIPSTWWISTAWPIASNRRGTMLTLRRPLLVLITSSSSLCERAENALDLELAADLLELGDMP
jgi:hypothetical protein